MVRCEECLIELVDKPTKNWDICEECGAKVCIGCLDKYHNVECDEAEEEDERETKAEN